VSAPACKLTDSDQAGFNTPVNGQAIDIIRYFADRGVVVWGARTLDGNNSDYRYIPVRRTAIYLERSIAIGLESYVFAPNDAGTWTAVTSSVANFLTGLWQQGAIHGATVRDAFSVSCGLGSTMTQQDVLDGNLIVQISVALLQPAEFIALRFGQKVGGTG
jgi:phage tail sheath protein FI